jgi:putative flippase GtrA
MKHILKQFFQREAHPFIQFIKYGISGCTASAIDIILFYVLCIWIIPAIGSNDVMLKILPFDIPVADISDNTRAFRFALNSVISFIFSNGTSYLMNIIWVFERGKHKWYVELLLFYSASGISIVIGTLIGSLAIKYFGATTTVSFIAKAVAALMLNFICRKFIIFKG